MNFKSKINHFRRKIMKAVTGNVKCSYTYEKIPFEDLKLERILISRPNQRLGNTLLITPLVQDLIKFNPNVTIDLFVKGGVSYVIFENYPQINQIIQLPRKPFKDLVNYIKVWLRIRKNKYDLVINVHEESASGRISTKIARSKYKLFGNEFLTDLKCNEQIHLGKIPVYQFRSFVEQVTGYRDNSEYPTLNLNLKPEEVSKGKQILNQIIVDKSKPTLSFFTYATGDKCYIGNWWKDFYEQFKNEFEKEYNLIEILPVENISMLNHQLPSFYSQNIREIAAVMDNCELLVAADSGMMHLGCATKTHNLGLFKSGNTEKYKPYGDGNKMALVTDISSEGLIEKMKEILQNKN